MSQTDKEYEKYIRFYLDSIFSKEPSGDIKPKYQANPNKNFLKYIREFSGDDNYLLSSPMNAFWNLTSACNFRCKHCLYNEGEYSPVNDLSKEQASSLAQDLIDCGITYIVLSGGEIFTRPDLMDIVRKFKENNVAVRLLTNGALIKDEHIDELGEIFNPYTDAIDISLDGATFETFKKIRQTDSFEKITSNIKKLADKNIKITAVCTVNSINYNEVIETYKLTSDLGAYGFIVGKVVDYNDNIKNIMISNKDLFKLYYNLMQNKLPQGPKIDVNFWTSIELLNIPEVKPIIEEEQYQNLIKNNYTKILPRNCHCHDKIAIKSDGTIYLCLEAIARDIESLGNYKKTPLEEIWQNRMDNVLFRQRKLENMKCRDCRYNTYCNGGCVVRAYAATNDINSPQLPSCQPSYL